MKAPTPEQINHWLAFTEKWIPRKLAKLEREPHRQATHTTLAETYASHGRSKFLRGDPLPEVREAFRQAALHILKSFTMAYDPEDPNYQGDQADPSCTTETLAIDGFNYALIADDGTVARSLAHWFKDDPGGRTLGPDINSYAHALAATISGNKKQARELLENRRKQYSSKSTNSPAELNYETLVRSLSGIVTFDDELFAEGISEQLRQYQASSGEIRNTDEGFVCDNAVALSNLALHCGVPVLVEHDLLPKGLLIAD